MMMLKTVRASKVLVLYIYIYRCVFTHTNSGEIIRWSGLQGQLTRHVTKKTIHTLTSINPKTLNLCWNSNFDLKNWTGSVKVKTEKTKSFSFSIFIFGALSLSLWSSSPPPFGCHFLSSQRWQHFCTCKVPILFLFLWYRSCLLKCFIEIHFPKLLVVVALCSYY